MKWKLFRWSDIYWLIVGVAIVAILFMTWGYCVLLPPWSHNPYVPSLSTAASTDRITKCSSPQHKIRRWRGRTSRPPQAQEPGDMCEGGGQPRGVSLGCNRWRHVIWRDLGEYIYGNIHCYIRLNNNISAHWTESIRIFYSLKMSVYSTSVWVNFCIFKNPVRYF